MDGTRTLHNPVVHPLTVSFIYLVSLLINLCNHKGHSLRCVLVEASASTGVMGEAVQETKGAPLQHRPNEQSTRD